MPDTADVALQPFLIQQRGCVVVQIELLIVLLAATGVKPDKHQLGQIN
jgi:hypothetical protein